MRESPRRPRITVNFGVTGHRDLNLPDESKALLQDKIELVLKAVSKVVIKEYNSPLSPFNDLSPQLRVISPLAEGVDRLVAHKALALDYELQCPLPFAREEYEKDFKSKESVDEFRTLLSKANAVLELDGTEMGRETGEAYVNASEVMIHQSDLLIAVWRGQESGGKGGAWETVEKAKGMGIPVVWINAREPFNIVIIDKAGRYEDWTENLEQRLRGILNPFNTDTLSETYFRETKPRINWGFPFVLFRNMIGNNRMGSPNLTHKDFVKSTEREWKSAWEKAPGLPDKATNNASRFFCEHYAWADRLAVYYSGLYRSTYLTKYIFLTMAVMSVAASAFVPNPKWVVADSMASLQWKGFLLIQVVFMIATVGLIIKENRRGWHQRFVDYRLLAELIRTVRFLYLLGYSIPSIHFPEAIPHRTDYGTKEDDEYAYASWVNWMFRAVVREAGMVDARIDRSYLEAYRTFLIKSELVPQYEFHEINEPICNRIDRRMSALSMFFFILGLGAFALRAIGGYIPSVTTIDLAKEIDTYAKICAIIFPTLGAAFAGIRSQGEFPRLAMRSRGMKVKIQRTIEKLLDTEIPNYNALSQVSGQIAMVMVQEVSDWHLLIKAKPLSLPV
ncbi:MAG: hypothetical protein ACM3PP_01235 [Candidatus Saccharibacteria bacterium]